MSPSPPGRPFLVQLLAPDLMGVFLWGRPTREDVDALWSAWAALVDACAGPFDLVCDVRRVEHLTDDTFQRLVDHAKHRGSAVCPRRRLVLLVTPNLVGAIAHGMPALISEGRRWSVVTSEHDAAAGLGRDRLDLASIDELVRRAREPGVVERLDRWFEAHIEDAGLGAAARALGMSPRTLQRHLAEAGTSFRSQLRLARLRLARGMLRAPHAKITAVAAAVGCTSTSSFVRMFREHHGVTPMLYRDGLGHPRW